MALLPFSSELTVRIVCRNYDSMVRNVNTLDTLLARQSMYLRNGLVLCREVYCQYAFHTKPVPRLRSLSFLLKVSSDHPRVSCRVHLRTCHAIYVSEFFRI